MGIIDTVVDIYGAMSALEQKALLVRLGQKAIDDGVIDAPVVDTSPPAGGGGSKYSKKGRGKPWGRIVTKVDTSAKGMNKLEGEWFNFGDVEGLMKKQKEMSGSGREPIIIGHTNKAGEKSYIAGFSPALAWSYKDVDADSRLEEHTATVEFKDGDLMIHSFGVEGCMEIYYGDMYFKFADAVAACHMLLNMFDPIECV
jgi:hypothetical protein